MLGLRASGRLETIVGGLRAIVGVESHWGGDLRAIVGVEGLRGAGGPMRAAMLCSGGCQSLVGCSTVGPSWGAEL